MFISMQTMISIFHYCWNE